MNGPPAVACEARLDVRLDPIGSGCTVCTVYRTAPRRPSIPFNKPSSSPSCVVITPVWPVVALHASAEAAPPLESAKPTTASSVLGHQCPWPSVPKKCMNKMPSCSCNVSHWAYHCCTSKSAPSTVNQGGFSDPTSNRSRIVRKQIPPL